jgi:hypothetical protein
MEKKTTALSSLITMPMNSLIPEYIFFTFLKNVVSHSVAWASKLAITINYRISFIENINSLMVTVPHFFCFHGGQHCSMLFVLNYFFYFNHWFFLSFIILYDIYDILFIDISFSLHVLMNSRCLIKIQNWIGDQFD